MITITILSDNRPSSANPTLCAEHGLSLWVECNGVRMLVDTGASDLYLRNAEQLGIEVAKTDMVVLSHAHRDHTGGINHLPEQLLDKPLYVAENLFDKECYSVRGGVAHNISAPKLELPIKQVAVAGVVKLSDQILLLSADDYGYPRPLANRYLTCVQGGVECADDFAHEITVCLTTPSGLVIISPCSHRGAANIIASCRERTGEERVAAFVGGLHLPDYDGVEREAESVARVIAEVAPDAAIYTGHCSSDRAITTMEALLPNLHRLYVGLTISV